MNNRISTHAFSSVLLATMVFATSAGTIDPAFSIGTWANFCQGAISHTFDDYGQGNVVNAAGQNGTGEAAFDAKGFHSTIFVVTGSASATTWTNLKYAFSKGHEVASHSVTHAGTMPASELPTSLKVIKTNVPGEMCATIAYPNCNTPGDAEVLKNYIAGRNCNGSLNIKSPTNFAQIGAKGFGSGQGNYPNDANSMNSFADQAASSGGWAVCMHHGIGSDVHSWAVTNLTALKTHLDYLDQNRGKIWIETFGNVARYIKERDGVSVTAKTTTNDSIVVSLTDNLADSIFNYPLTIRREMPAGWTKVIATQKGAAVKDTVVTASGKTYIQFQAVPDGGDVVLKRNSPEAVIAGFAKTGTSPVVKDHSTLIIDTRYFGSQNLTVSLFNLNGKVLGHYSFAANKSRLPLPAEKIGNSSFIARITSGNKNYTGKFVSGF